MKRTLFVTLLACACSQPQEGESLDLVSLNVYSVQRDSLAEDPYCSKVSSAGTTCDAHVSLLHIQIDDRDGLVDQLFVHYTPGGKKAIPKLPFGDDLRFTIEGWTQLPDGNIGELVSRGRSQTFDLSEDSDPVTVNVMFSKVNAFARTTVSNGGNPIASGLSEARVGHTVTKLYDGRVLIAGGGKLKASAGGDITSPNDFETISSSAEIYDPATGLFTKLPSALKHPRAFHTATALPDDTVLFAGGITDIGGSKQTIGLLQVFNPATESFVDVAPSAAMAVTRAGHTATLVDGFGNVIFAGGFSFDQNGVRTTITNVEVMKPDYTFIFLGNLAEARAFHTATRVPVGPEKKDAIIFIGGENESKALDSIETYFLNPAGFDAAKLTLPLGDQGQAVPRTRHTATWIESQQFIHVVGGFGDVAHTSAVQKIDSFQVGAKAFQSSQPFYLLKGRGAHAAIPLPGNAILIAGGSDGTVGLDSAEVIFEFFNPNDGKIYIDRGGVGAMRGARVGAEGALLDNGTALVVGGAGAAGVAMPTTGEYFNPL